MVPRKPKAKTKLRIPKPKPRLPVAPAERVLEDPRKKLSRDACRAPLRGFEEEAERDE